MYKNIMKKLIMITQEEFDILNDNGAISETETDGVYQLPSGIRCIVGTPVSYYNPENTLSVQEKGNIWKHLAPKTISDAMNL